MKLSAAQWKAVLGLVAASLATLGVFFPEHAAGLDKLATLLGGVIGGGAFIRSPGHVSITHVDDMR